MLRVMYLESPVLLERGFVMHHNNKQGQTMSEVKIQFKLGSIEFSGEGEKEWISQQLDKILQQAPELLLVAPSPASAPTSLPGAAGHNPMGADPVIAQQPLASFLKSKNATTTQVKKFLATAIWLEAKGKSRMTTADITKALKDSNQTRIGNPADCLNQNITKGHCEKDGSQFFVTVEGKATV